MNLGRRLKARGVLGMNRRNIDYLLELNPRAWCPRADDKVLSKELARAHGIAVPDLYRVVSYAAELHGLPAFLSGFEDFVINPASGAGGDGILVIDTVDHGRFRRVNGEWLDGDAIRLHASDTLGGLHSLGGRPDRLMIEQRVLFDPVFEHVTVQGVPDVRIIVYKGVPVMAMLRLPTRMSAGRANLHQGAVGAGVTMRDGETFGGVWRDAPLETHPDTHATISGLRIPAWKTMLLHAARCSDMSSLGYLGVDFVLDRRLGPLMLEINARPGLAIQIANKEGLGDRLAKVDRAAAHRFSIDERVRFAREEF